MIDKIKISKKATELLDQLSRKIGLKRNILARNALIKSLGNGDSYNDSLSVRSNGMEFNIYTLLGDKSEIYYALLRQHYVPEPIDDKIPELIRFHIEMGLSYHEFERIFSPI